MLQLLTKLTTAASIFGIVSCAPLANPEDSGSQRLEDASLTLTEEDLIANYTWNLIVAPECVKSSIDPPSWLSNWDDIGFYAIGENYPLPNTDCSEQDVEVIAKYLVFNSFSGNNTKYPKGDITKRDLEINQAVESFWEVGPDSNPIVWDQEVELNGSLSKRSWWIFKTNLFNRIKRSSGHATTGGAMAALYGVITGSTNSIFRLTRSAICASDGQNQACFSWQGGEHSMLGSILLEYYASEVSYFHDFAGTSSIIAGWFKDDGYDKSSHQMCRSNRPDDC